jgi:hypothetical protein
MENLLFKKKGMIKTPQILKSLSHALQVTKQFQKTKSLFSPLLEHMTCHDFKKEIVTDPIVDSNSCNQINSSKLVFSGLFFFNLLPLCKEEKHISHFFSQFQLCTENPCCSIPILILFT